MEMSIEMGEKGLQESKTKKDAISNNTQQKLNKNLMVNAQRMLNA